MLASISRKTVVKKLNSPRRDIPKSLVIFFCVSQILFGINFGIVNLVKKRFHTLVKCGTFVISIFYIVILLTPAIYLIFRDVMWDWIGFIEYIAYFITMNTFKYKVIHFLIEINKIYSVTDSEKSVLCYIAIWYTVFIYILKCICIIIYCIYQEDYLNMCYDISLTQYMLGSIPPLGLDTIAVAQIIIFYYIFCFVRKLRKSMTQLDDVISFEKRYVDIVECSERISPLYDWITTLELTIGLPKLMFTIWYALFNIHNYSHWSSYISEPLFGIHIVMQIFIPAILTEMVYSQVDGIKSVLNKQWLIETDENKKTSIEHMLRCMEVRPLKHLAWRVIPLDLRLVVSVFSFCTTYFIVIIQFSHMYD